MPMDGPMASGIVVTCVKKVGGHKKVSEDKALNEVGIGTGDLVTSLIDTITNDRTIGVPSVDFQIDPNFFRDVDSSSLVSDVSDIVADNASSEVAAPATGADDEQA